ncbi:MAG: hypothetical protein Q9181_004907, partial [Wetmoreana brouardii]
MVSASKAARQAKRAEEGKDKKKTVASKVSSKAASKNASTASSVNGDETPPMLDGDGDPLPNDDEPATTDEKMSSVKKLTEQMDKHGLSDRVTTGVLASLAQSRDVKITSASLVFHGKVLITDTTLELNYGRRYGLLGENGCGKSTLLKSIDKREYPIPEHVDIYLLNEGAPPSELGALEWVVKEAENEMERLNKLAEEILEKNGPEDPVLEDLYERMDTMDPSTFQTRASLILTGLGFNKKTIHKKTKDMSGGWRMRVALAKALFVKPSLLLLDDPTAHLDLEACVWLEEYLKKWDRTLVLVSHSMDFLNGVCTNMIDMRMKQLVYYGGNYDTYIKTRSEQETNQMKAYAKQQEEIQHIKKFIASAGTYANLVRQAKSRQKILDKMEADGFIQPVHQDRVFTFRFADVEKLPPPVLSFDDVTFGYSGKPQDNLYENLDLGVDMDSRTALVGPNGVGKSTLLRLMTGKLSPVSGTVARHTHLKLGLYSQHSAEQLDLTKSALDFVRDKYSEKSQDYQYWRQQLGRYGLSGESQTALMGTLSEGQKSRIVFALLAIDGPNMLLLDEPTNGLDIPTIDSLADAINAFSGGVVVVSHDFRLLDKIAKDIIVCEHKTVKRWDGTIGEYKNYLRKKMVTMGQRRILEVQIDEKGSLDRRRLEIPDRSRILFQVPKGLRKFFKKSRSKPAPITATTSETLVGPEQTQPVTEAPSPASAESLQQASEENSVSGLANAVPPISSDVIQNSAHDSPAKQSSWTCNSTPSPESRTKLGDASSRSSLSATPFTVVSELPGSYTFHDAASSRSSLAGTPFTVVSELPSSYTFHDAASCIADVEEASALVDRRDEAREEEASHWGRLEDPFRDFCMVAPFGFAKEPSTPHITAISAHGTFVRSTSEDNASSAAPPMLSRTFDQNSVSTLDRKSDLAETASKVKPQQSIGHPVNEGIEGSADKSSVDSQTPSAWERALESQEQSFQNEIQDLREDHEAEVERYKNKITGLERDVKAAKDRKDYIQNLAKKREAEKDEEIALQNRELATAYADNDDKEAELKVKNSEIEEKDAKIKRLEDWTVYQSSLYSELKHEQTSTQMLLMDQPDVTELQSALAEACRERDSSKADLQQCNQVWNQTLGELNQAKELIMSQNVRLQIYMNDHEDHPSPLAEGSTLLKKSQEQYHELEKKANDCFDLWKSDAKKHGNEKIMLKSEIEQRLGMINNLEGANVLAMKEVARLTDILNRNVIANQVGSLDPHTMLQEMYEASQETVHELKMKNAQQQSQIAANEKENHQQKLTIRLRERALDDKNAELKDLSDAKFEAEREIDNLNTKVDMRDLAVKEDADTKEEQIQWANKHIGDLEAHIESLMQPGLGGGSNDIEACHQEAIFNLQQRIVALEAENNEYFERQAAQRNKDMHDGQCAAQGEINLKIYQDNWQNSQEEIAKLKQHIELIGQGCDPEKFEIAKDCSRLREEYGMLEKKYLELLDDTQKMYW